MNFWQGFVIGVIITQIFVGLVMVKAGIIGDFVAYLESGLTKRAADGVPPQEPGDLTPPDVHEKMWRLRQSRRR